MCEKHARTHTCVCVYEGRKNTCEQTTFPLIIFDHSYKVDYSNERRKNKCLGLFWNANK